MRIGRTLAILALLALFASSAMALSGSGGNNPPLTGFASVQTNGTNGALAGTLNTYHIFSAFAMNSPTTWSHICVYVIVADAVNKYDIGIVNASGTLLADIGAQSIPSTATQCFAIMANANCTGPSAPSPFCTGAGTGTAPTSVTSPPGLYRVVATGNAATVTVQEGQGGSQFALSADVPTTGVTANGILPSSVAALTVAPTLAADVNIGLALY